jgi:hypothetical protein
MEWGPAEAYAWRSSLAAPAVVSEQLCVRSLHAGDASAADLRAAAVMLLVGGDVPDRRVQANGVVLEADPRKLGVEGGWIADLREVGPVAFEVAEEAP